MSFILDALRKSEHQRQKNATPGIADTRIRPEAKKRSPWLAAIIALLGLNSLLLAGLWLNAKYSAPEVAETTTRPVETTLRPAPTRVTGNRKLSNELSGNPTVSAPAPAPVVAPATPAQTATAPLSNQSAEPYGNRTIGNNPPPATAEPAVDDGLPSLETLQLRGVFTLPPMRIDLHVYSDIPADRFVFINMNKHREGTTLTEGPVVETITKTGVIMRYQGERFVMTRD